MSYILDALRRSEQDRLRLQGHSELTAPDLPQAGRRWLPWVLLVVLSLNAAALGWLFMRQAPTPAPSVSASEPDPPTRSMPALKELTGRPGSLRTESVAAPPLQAPVPAQATAVAPAPSPAISEPDAPLLSSLSESFRRSLPDISINVHVFAEQPSARFVLIDGRSLREGQSLTEKLRLERITQDGVIMSYEGQFFRVLR